MDPFLIPDRPYAKGGHHFSNGATWVEQFARPLGLEGSVQPALRSPGSGATNYAVGGARAYDAGGPFDFPRQVERFLQDFGGAAPASALYVIEMGGNDLRDALVSASMGGDPGGVMEAALGSIAHNITRLYMAGATDFLVWTAPDIGLTPAISSIGASGPAAMLTFVFTCSGTASTRRVRRTRSSRRKQPTRWRRKPVTGERERRPLRRLSFFWNIHRRCAVLRRSSTTAREEVPMKTGFVTAALFITLALPASGQAQDAVLEFETMAGVSGPFKGTANAIRGVPGGGLAWRLAQAKGELKRDGRLEIRVRGLVFAEGPNTGINTVPNFRAIISCQAIDQIDNPIFITLTTDLFPATRAGDSDIEANMQLPGQCLAPIIFVTSPGGSWFAVTGF